MVFCVVLPVVHINIRKARDKEFQLLLIEYGDELLGDNIIETCIELAI